MVKENKNTTENFSIFTPFTQGISYVNHNIMYYDSFKRWIQVYHNTI